MWFKSALLDNTLILYVVSRIFLASISGFALSSMIRGTLIRLVYRFLDFTSVTVSHYTKLIKRRIKPKKYN